MTRRLAIVFAAIASLALAQDRPVTTPTSPPAQSPAPDPAKPPIQKLDEFRYQVGGITFNKKTREIRFPAKVNMAAGLLEYLVCQQQGKIHEALLITAVSPTHLNLAFTLLRYPPSPELNYLLDENGMMIDRHPEVAATVKAAARIAIDVEWNDQGTTRRGPVNEWLQHSVKTTAMSSGPWLYSGSEFREGKFVAEISGDIVSIMIDAGALINYPGTDNGDNVWFAYPKRVPPEGTRVTVIISPYSSTRPLPIP